jgi:uncharacterized membrane protein YoaK (UPF0700 family)
MKLLPSLLSVIAGCVDTISFLGLGGLFAAHVTGNLVILAAHVAAGGEAPVADMLAVPVFVVTLGLARLVASGLERINVASLSVLLFLQLLFLVCSFAFGIAAGPHLDPSGPRAIAAGMLGVAAMAVQNALVQIALRDAPSTAVMTTNITRFVMDLGEVLLGRNPDSIARSRTRALSTWPAIVGFAAGCAIGAVCEHAVGLWSLVLPIGLALLAVAMALSNRTDAGRSR